MQDDFFGVKPGFADLTPKVLRQGEKDRIPLLRRESD
jgi:hypothetical protein